MASSHHQCHCHHNHHPPSCGGSCCCYSTTCCPPATDLLLQTLVAQLLRSQTQQQHLHLDHHHPSSPPFPNHHHYGVHTQPPSAEPYQHLHRRHHHHLQQQQQTPPLQSLIQRVAALETSLRDLPHKSKSSPVLLHDHAARVIQKHFRLFLVRRSQTLRSLRRLASIRSKLDSLKSSLHHLPSDPRALCQQASHLLLLLDSIQSEDSLVRQGKSSISGDIAGIVEVLEQFPLRRPLIPSNAAKQKKHAQVAKSKVDGNAASEGRQENIIECDRSSRVSTEEEEEDDDDVGDEGKVVGGGDRRREAALLGLYAPLPIKMESRMDK